MQIRFALFGTVLVFLTGVSPFSIASQNLKPSKIICIETEASQESTTDKEIGRITITLDQKGTASLVQINRSSVSALPAINKTFSINSASIKHEAIVTDVENITKRNKKTETVSVTDSKGRTFTLKIDDQSEINWTGSSYFYEDGKISFSTREESTLLKCEGKLMFPEKLIPALDIVSGK